jgi:hypothetical protein
MTNSPRTRRPFFWAILVPLLLAVQPAWLDARTKTATQAWLDAQSRPAQASQ